MIGWRPWANRNSEPDQRVHETLTDDARRRIAFALNQTATEREIQDAHEEYCINRGTSIGYFNTRNTGSAKNALYKFVTEEEDDGEVLTLLELLLKEIWSNSNTSTNSHSAKSMFELDEKLRQIFLEEGILLKLTPDRETVAEHASAIESYYNESWRRRGSWPKRDWNFQFELQAHGAVIDSDQSVRMLGRQERWEDVLAPYDEAWEAYQNPPVSYVVAEKLYNALEGTLAKICVEEQGWNSEGDGVAAYIESLKDNGIFEPNPAMVHEWRQITEGLKAGVQKTGGDRKRHEEFDEDYALLLLHQVGAFLSFVVSRYEDEYGN